MSSTSFLSLRLKKPWWKYLTSKIQSKLHKKLNKAIAKRKSRRKASINSGPTSRPAHKSSLKRRPTKRRALAGFFLFKRHHRSRLSVPIYQDMDKWRPQTVDHDQMAEIEQPMIVTAANNDDDGDVAWESTEITSPLMRGIDARAEEFIANFRADMEVQEMLARGL